MSHDSERELTFVWKGDVVVVDSLPILSDWGKATKNYVIVDSIYDTDTHDLANQNTGLRLRTKDNRTEVTVKKFLGNGSNGEATYDEYTHA
jgi:inorganic triphosphatase YgiF